MTLYRKYRPQKLSELDSTDVKERLVRILSSSYTPHAFLFTGQKGTGKTSAARIIAKILNCEKKTENKEQITQSSKTSKPESDIEPCNSCETCKAITEGRFLDVIEIDAASNRGIDEIRDLREKIKLAPVSARFKVYIIDEVHMLTNEAFNALLKTLEEPPSHAVFILATTESEKLPATIISRCIKFNFHRAKIAEVIHCLKRVASGEGLKVPDNIIETIAGVSDGSFRDATKILEQAILENALTIDSLNLLLGREVGGAESFLQILIKKDEKKILNEIKKMVESGANVRLIIEDMLALLHSLLLAQHDVEVEKVSPDLIKAIDKTEIIFLIKLFSRVFVEIKNTSLPYLPLEVALVEWCEGKNQQILKSTN